jgi:hypothetical protein
LVHAEHDAAPRHHDGPRAFARARRLYISAERESIAAGNDLERHPQHAAPCVPFEIEFSAVDGKRGGTGGLGQKAGFGDEAALKSLRRAVRPDLGTQTG